MNCEEVNIVLNDYIDELLDSSSKKEIETHLQTCDKCYNQYKRLRKLFDKIKQVPYAIEPPADLISRLTNELMKRAEAESPEIEVKLKSKQKKLKREQILKENKLKAARGVERETFVSRTLFSKKDPSAYKRSSGLRFKYILLALLPIILIGISYFIYDYTKLNSPWKVRVIQGRVLVNGQVNENDRLGEGQSFLTEIDSRAVVNIPRIGRIEVEPFTLFILTKAKDGDNRIRLEKGEIKVISTEQLPAFVVEMKNLFIKDIYGTFNILINESGDAELSVEVGTVEIVKGNNIYFIDDNNICIIRERTFPGIPYRIDADEILKQEITKINEGAFSGSSLGIIMNAARKSDALTLLALIPRVTKAERTTLFEKISSFYPPPKSVTLEGIIKLDKKLLENWWFEIEWQI